MGLPEPPALRGRIAVCKACDYTYQETVDHLQSTFPDVTKSDVSTVVNHMEARANETSPEQAFAEQFVHIIGSDVGDALAIAVTSAGAGP
jgi:hypothetical protein